MSEPSGAASEGTGLRITALVGTDHHPFVRLVEWADARRRSRPQDDVLVQHGSSPAPREARGVAFVKPDELTAMTAAADVLITHGGPGTIMDARRAGHRPFVLPRDPAHGEHVDRHQMEFADWCDTKGLIRLVRDLDRLNAMIDELGARGTRESIESSGGAEGTPDRLARLLSEYDGRRFPRALDALPVDVVVSDDPGRRAQWGERLAVGGVWLGDVDRVGASGSAPPRCACGRPVTGCDAWSSLVEAAFGGWDGLRASGWAELSGRLRSREGRRRLARRHPGSDLRHRVLELAALHRRLYQSACALAGADRVVASAESLDVPLALSHHRHLRVRVTGDLSRRARALLAYRGVDTAPDGPAPTTDAPTFDVPHPRLDRDPRPDAARETL